MSRLVAFICDKCHTLSKQGEKKGWITMYATLDPASKKNTTMHLCPDCTRKALYQLWEDPQAVAEANKKLLDEKLKLESNEE